DHAAAGHRRVAAVSVELLISSDFYHGVHGERPRSFVLARVKWNEHRANGMLPMKNVGRMARMLGVAALVLALGACDDAFGPGLEVEIGEVVLRVGDVSTTVRAGGSGALTVDEGTHDVTINVRDSD